MTGIFNTALIGLFALSGATGTISLATPTATAPIEPSYRSYTVAMTGYNAVAAQTDGDPHITASGAYSNPDIIAARSQDLADELPFGTVIQVTAASSSPNCGYGLVDKQVGLRVIGDSMHSRMRNKVDILFDMQDTVRAGGKETNPAIALGVCKRVQIRVVGKIDMKNIPGTQTGLRLAVGMLPIATQQPLAVYK
ncbi:MAG: hypothetical protein AAB480_00675 [Patescibacteria group bacterium]